MYRKKFQSFPWIRKKLKSKACCNALLHYSTSHYIALWRTEATLSSTCDFQYLIQIHCPGNESDLKTVVNQRSRHGTQLTAATQFCLVSYNLPYVLTFKVTWLYNARYKSPWTFSPQIFRPMAWNYSCGNRQLPVLWTNVSNANALWQFTAINPLKLCGCVTPSSVYLQTMYCTCVPTTRIHYFPKPSQFGFPNRSTPRYLWGTNWSFTHHVD